MRNAKLNAAAKSVYGIFVVYQLIHRRRFQQMEVLENQNILVTISGKKNRLRVYYLSWLRNKILRTDASAPAMDGKRAGWMNQSDIQGAVHFKIVKYERIKFLVIALRDAVEIHAWAPKPYHKFMQYKVCDQQFSYFPCYEMRGTMEFHLVESLGFSRF